MSKFILIDLSLDENIFRDTENQFYFYKFLKNTRKIRKQGNKRIYISSFIQF